MTLDMLISQLQGVQATSGNIRVQVFEFYGADKQQDSRSIFRNEIHLSYAEEEEEEEPQPEPPKPRPIGFV